MRRLLLSLPVILASTLSLGQSLPFPGPGNTITAVCAPGTVIFITSGTTWNNTTGCNNFTIETYGAGGGGAAAEAANGVAGGAGAAAGYSKVSAIGVSPSGTVGIAVGAVGAGGATAGANGGTGGDTYFCITTTNCASIS